MSIYVDMDSLNAGMSFTAAVLSAVMAVGTVLSRAEGRTLEGRAFTGMCLTDAAMAVGDFLSWALPLPLGPVTQRVVLAGNFIFNVAGAVLFVCYTGYLHGVFDRAAASLPNGRANYPFERVGLAIAALDSVGCAVSLVTGAFFTAGFGTRYYRGEFFWVMQLMLNFLYIQVLMTIVANRRLLGAREIMALLTYIMLPGMVNIVQSLFFGAALINVAITMSLVFIFMGVQHERELEAARREHAMAKERLRLIQARIDPEDLYARLDAARTALNEDPAQAVRLIGDTSRWLRERMSALARK